MPDVDAEAALFRDAMRELGLASGDVMRPRVADGDAPADAASQDRAADEAALFREAMARLDEAPNKDRPRPPRPEATIRRRRVPRMKGLVIEDRLDLHHATVVEAQDRLRRFLIRSKGAKRRVVLVITGKGYRSPGGRSVLRREVEQWLLRHGKPWVESYAEAPGAAGGRGAFVLYLR